MVVQSCCMVIAMGLHGLALWTDPLHRQMRTCAFVLVSSVGSPACAGWTSRTLAAPWAARYGHTTVIDSAGAIYVIGGYSSTVINHVFNDVWVSNDGGADRTRARNLRGIQGQIRGTKVYQEGVLTGYS
jgi:hypothetical protein